jgi:hypothetical protein
VDDIDTQAPAVNDAGEQTNATNLEADANTVTMEVVTSHVEDRHSRSHITLIDITHAIPEDDVIVYDAPMARISRAVTSATPVEAEPDPKIATSSQITMEALALSLEKSATIVPQQQPFSCKKTPKESRKQLQKRRELIQFGAFGAASEELRLNEMVNASHHPSQRRRDSDIEWGSVFNTSDSVSETDMLDPEIDQDGFGGFLKSIKGLIGSNQVTIDDLDDAARHREEDEDSDVVSSDDDQLPQDDGDKLDSLSSSSEAGNVNRSGSSFQVQLARIRKPFRKSQRTFVASGDFEDEDASELNEKSEVCRKGERSCCALKSP